jgi:hypothetical protein
VIVISVEECRHWASELTVRSDLQGLKLVVLFKILVLIVNKIFSFSSCDGCDGSLVGERLLLSAAAVTNFHY